MSYILPAHKDAARDPGRFNQRQAIEAHPTIVVATLAVARHLQDTTGMSTKRIIRIL